MGDEDYYDQDETDRKLREYTKLMKLHRELAGLYRSRSTDRRTIATLWHHVDALELSLRAEGVEL